MRKVVCTFTVGPGEAGSTLGSILRRCVRVSTSILRRLKREGGLLVDGVPAPVTHVVRDGQVIQLVDDVSVNPDISPEDIELSVAYEDPYLIVIDKPAGRLVHPVKKHRSGTVANGLVQLYLTRGEVSGIHPVHRLDRDTSGLVLIAKDPLTHSEMARQLDSGELSRGYIALVDGVVRDDSAVIDRRIGISPGSFIARTVVDGSDEGVEAVTRYKVLTRIGRHSLLELELETGRTHQIRVHLASIGHPVTGDTLYGRGSELIGRQALHAHWVRFRHPRSMEEIELTSPIPADMQAAIEKAKSSTVSLPPSRTDSQPGAPS